MSTRPNERARMTQFAYLDLLASALTEHEKNLDTLIERLEAAIDRLITELGRDRAERGEGSKRTDDSSKVGKRLRGKPEEEPSETITYIKLKLNRSPEELKMILDSLKE